MEINSHSALRLGHHFGSWRERVRIFPRCQSIAWLHEVNLEIRYQVEWTLIVTAIFWKIFHVRHCISFR